MTRKIFLTAFTIVVISVTAHCQSEQLVVNLSPSSMPGLLTFENPKGSIKVTGYDGDVLLATGTLRYSNTGKPVNGMRRIEQKVLDISAEVEGTNIILMCTTTGKTVDFDIKLPGNFSLKLKSLDNGNIEVINMNGEIEAENANGDITLGNIAGSAVLSSVYGKIEAVFREVDPKSPMMFTSFEGDISITLPESVNARLKLKSDNGEILSDFDITPLKRQSVITKDEDTVVYSLEDWVVGTINEGGPEYIISSYNGNLFIRKKTDIL